MRRLLSKIKRFARTFSKSKPELGSPATGSEAGPRKTINHTATASSPEADRKKPVCIDPHFNAPIENLPPEVRRHLLYSLDINTLNAMIRASPVYYQQYRLDQRHILGDCLESALRDVTVDACAVHLSSLAEFSKTRTEESIGQFLKSYHERRCSPQHTSLYDKLTAEDTLKMAKFYTAIVQPLIRTFTLWALGNISHDSDSPPTHPTPLSQTEETRLLRAFYRVQLFCNLFGLRPGEKAYNTELEIADVNILHILLSPFNPWEVEEIACVASFMKTHYTRILESITWDLHPDNPRFADQLRPPTPDGAFELGLDYNRDRLLHGVCSRGLDLLHKALTIEKQDHERLVILMQGQLSTTKNGFLDGLPGELLSDTTQHFRREQWPSEQDIMTTRRDPLPFLGDRVDSPPLAWTLMWGGTYSNIYGWWMDNKIGGWGYVLWDAERIECSGAKEYLLQKVDNWRGRDPRRRAGM